MVFANGARAMVSLLIVNLRTQGEDELEDSQP